MEGPGCAVVLRAESLTCVPAHVAVVNIASFHSLSRSSISVSPSASPKLLARFRPQFSFSNFNHSKSRRLRTGLSIPKCNRGEVSGAENRTEEKVGNFLDEEFSNGRNSRSEEQTSENLKILGLEGPETSEGGQIDWLAQWYPVAVLKHMDKRQPTPMTILGRDLVLWWDRGESRWQVFADVCPHRSAPLSEGRINEDGHLQCSYHGWSFSSSGACTLIPQAPKELEQVKDSKRACAKVYLSQQHHGMLWVFMDRSEGAEQRANANPPPFIPVLDDPDFVYDLTMSDTCYSYEALLENFLDPAHVPFAHHNIQSTRKSARPLELEVFNFGKKGFEGKRAGRPAHKFSAPCLSMAEFSIPPRSAPQGHPLALKLREFIISKKKSGVEVPRRIATLFLCVPTVPGRSRVIFAFPRNFAKWVFYLTPKWINHIVHMAVLDSDAYLLHLMEHRLEGGGGMANIEKLYYTPVAADAFVVGFRKWLKRFGGGAPDFGPKGSALPPRSLKTEVLDRSSLHVANCKICSRAQRSFKAVEVVLHVLPFILVGLVAASFSSFNLGWVSHYSVPLICVAVVSSVASRWLSYWIKKHYEYFGYNHALVK